MNNQTLLFLKNGKIQELQSIKFKVQYIYNNSQEAIECDNTLLYIYRKLYGSTQNQEDSIKRSGRFWRQKKSALYKRSDQKVIKDKALSIVQCEVWK